MRDRRINNLPIFLARVAEVGLTGGLILRRIPHNRSSTGEHWEPAFAAALSRAGLASLTIQTYRHEVRCFVHWLEERTGAPVRLQTLAAVALLSYRQHLINVEQGRPATVNKQLQALRWLCRWAQHQGIVEAAPAAVPAAAYS